MTTKHRTAVGAGLIVLGLLAAAGCGSSASSPAAGAPAAGYPAASSNPAGASGSTPSSAAAAATTVRLKTAKTSVGTVLTNAQGFTLYWFAKDTATTSACSGVCADDWPPVIGHPVAASGVTLTGKLGTIKRAGGSLQATYDGHPLYTYAGDTAAGQVSGNDLNDFGDWWYATTASGTSAATNPEPSASQSSGGGGGY